MYIFLCFGIFLLYMIATLLLTNFYDLCTEQQIIFISLLNLIRQYLTLKNVQKKVVCFKILQLSSLEKLQ